MSGHEAEPFWATVHRELVESFHVEESGWAAQLVERAAARLHAVRPGEAFRPVVLWSGMFNAFTMPGPYIYVSREILSRGLSEEGVAFVLAHEMGHHDLGHLDWNEGDSLISFAGSMMKRVLDNIRFGLEQEMEADRYGLDMCFAADYDERGALEFFDLAKRVALDYRMLDAVFEPDGPGDGWAARTLQWVAGTAPTHPTIEARRAAVERLL